MRSQLRTLLSRPGRGPQTTALLEELRTILSRRASLSETLFRGYSWHLLSDNLFFSVKIIENLLIYALVMLMELLFN
jgi:hypothetical protein